MDWQFEQKRREYLEWEKSPQGQAHKKYTEKVNDPLYKLAEQKRLDEEAERLRKYYIDNNMTPMDIAHQKCH